MESLRSHLPSGLDARGIFGENPDLDQAGIRGRPGATRGEVAPLRIQSPFVLAALLATAAGCGEDGRIAALELSSIAFGDGDTMPALHTCDGEGVSPPLRFDEGPEGTASYALTLEREEEEGEEGVHWALWGIDPGNRFIAQGQPAAEVTFEGTQGANAEGGLGYLPPCSDEDGDDARHRYVFTVYALDVVPTLDPGSTLEALKKAMEGHVIGYGTLVGYYHQAG
jgi:Raf kinase inhibitor-like YbhB/YbcL family protein